MREKSEGRIEGRIEATAEAILELLEVLGPVPGHLSSVICSETDLELLKKLAPPGSQINLCSAVY